MHLKVIRKRKQQRDFPDITNNFPILTEIRDTGKVFLAVCLKNFQVFLGDLKNPKRYLIQIFH